MVAQRSVPV